CLLSVAVPPGGPVPGISLEVDGPTTLVRGQRGVPLFVVATTTGPIDALSLALTFDRRAVTVIAVDFEETIFPASLRPAFESSAFFRSKVIPQTDDARDLLLFGTIFIDADRQRIRFPATTGPLVRAPLLRLLVDVPSDAPLGQTSVLE